MFDAKDGRGASPLNPGDKEAYTADISSEWGLITHADLTTICTMILNFEAEMAGALGGSFSLKDVILIKVDLSKMCAPLIVLQSRECSIPRFRTISN